MTHAAWTRAGAWPACMDWCMVLYIPYPWVVPWCQTQSISSLKLLCCMGHAPTQQHVGGCTACCPCMGGHAGTSTSCGKIVQPMNKHGDASHCMGDAIVQLHAIKHGMHPAMHTQPCMVVTPGHATVQVPRQQHAIIMVLPDRMFPQTKPIHHRQPMAGHSCMYQDVEVMLCTLP